MPDRFTVDKFHDERARAASFFDAVDLRDVRMIESGERLRLTREPREAIPIRSEERRHNLQCHIATELGVACAVNLAHAARAEHRNNFVRADSGAGGETHL